MNNMLAVEFSACERFGIDPFIEFQRDREWRKAIVGYHIGRASIDAMHAYDKHPPKGGK